MSLRSTCRCTPRDAQATAKKLRNYGSLFIGELASVVYSDKCCGTNHTLPTMGAGRYTGGLWVGAYVKIATHQWLDERGVEAVAPPAARQSASERLEGHRRAAQIRLDRLQKQKVGMSSMLPAVGRQLRIAINPHQLRLQERCFAFLQERRG